ncbi:hypothetical protein IU449_27350 [Nocardia higoensis]|uniref:Minor tail protein n=1 Tax=Nocardia higoensis TaxID=228599 RepID=A0ABS0DJY5_9NOCA|nr:hypothetical protein [Nocardia higoensis]MBF6358218.1 hypothetical protein [Nocardia higoensis]
MSFLIKRNPPWAWSGWYDQFSRPPESPLKQPWQKWGTNLTHEINADNQLHIGHYVFVDVPGGVSYEFEPFTKNYGFEARVWFPANDGLVANSLLVLLMANWAKNYSGSYSQATLVAMAHQPAIDGDTIKVYESASLGVSNTVIGSGAVPTAFYGAWFTVRIWVDNDALVRVWMNDFLVVQAMLNGSFRTAPGKRGLNIAAERKDAWLDWIKWFDRPTDFVLPGMSELFFDNFNRTNGAVGNGWTQIGTDAAIVSNSWSTTGATNGGRGLLRDSGITNGAQQIEGVIGGNIAPNDTTANGLILRSNASGTEGLIARFARTAVRISRFSSSLSGGSITYSHGPIDTTSLNLQDGDVCRFSCNGNTAWVDVNGVRSAMAQVSVTELPTTNSWMGAFVQRANDANSASWNSLRLMQAAL